MRIDGTAIASHMYVELRERVLALQKKGIIPHLVVFLVGDNPASVAYVTLKQKKGEEIGAKVTIMRFDASITTDELCEKLTLINDDPFVHGILIQRPLPDHIDVDKLELLTNPQKDIDGFHPDSPFTLPLPLAVGKILEEVYILSLQAERSNLNEIDRHAEYHSAHDDKKTTSLQAYKNWLQSKKIILIGKGPTGGGPILAYLKTLGVTPTLIDSKTQNPDAVMKQADIIISAVGKEHVVKKETIKKGVILISVGIMRGEDKKLKGDYDAEEIAPIASYFTPTPGGVGPVNVAKLMENLLTATENQTMEMQICK